MSFNPNIPSPTDRILQSAKQLKLNFQAINSAFATNHQNLTSDPSIAGMHNILTMQQVMTDPVTSAIQVALYNKSDGTTPELFYKPNNNQNAIQLTYSSIKSDLSDDQYSFIAGPFVVYLGLLKSVANNQLVTLLPSTNLVYVNLQMTNPIIKVVDKVGINIAFTVYPVAVIANTFRIGYNFLLPNNVFDVYYVAIGTP